MARRPTVRRTLRLETLESRMVLSAFTPPDNNQQYMLELLNQARTNPAAAAQRYTTNLDSGTQATVQFYNVDLGQVSNAISNSQPRQPLAWNSNLAAAALGHSQDMAKNNFQSHSGSDGSGPSDRVAQTGYNAASVAENAFAYAESVDNAMEAFMVDWGTDGGHRRNILQQDVPDSSSNREVGIGIIKKPAGTGTGPLVITQDFGSQPGASADLLGVVYNDRDHNNFYTPGEGLGGVNIDVTNLNSGAVSHTQTWGSGGWQLPVNPGLYQVTARQGGQVIGNNQVNVGTQNVEVDFVQNTPIAKPVVSAPTFAATAMKAMAVSAPTPPAPTPPAPVTPPAPIATPTPDPAPTPTPDPAQNSAPASTPTPDVATAAAPAPTPTSTPTDDTPTIDAQTMTALVVDDATAASASTDTDTSSTSPFDSGWVLLGFDTWKADSADSAS